jgi:O-antigen ligase
MTPRALPISVAAVVVLLPVGDTSVPGLGLPLVYVAMMVPAGLALRSLVRDEVRLPPSLVLLGSVLGLTAGMVSTAVGIVPDRSVHLVVVSFLTLGYAVAVLLAFRPGLEVDGADLLVVVGGVVAALALTSAAQLQAAEGGNVVVGRLTGPFAQPNELGLFCAALLPLAVACGVTTVGGRRRFVIGLAAACLAVACLMSMSRGAWLGAGAALVLLAVCAPPTRRALAAVGLALAATCLTALAVPPGAAVLGVLGSRMRTLGDPTQNQYDDRPLTWAEAVRQAGEHPWFGVGPGGFHEAATKSVSAVSAQPPEHPHNLLLTVLTDRGVVGVALGLVVVIGCVVAAIRHLPAGVDPARASTVLRTRSLGVVAALTAVAVHGAFDMPLRNPIVSGLVWTLIGMVMVAETTRPSDKTPMPARRDVPGDRITRSRT